MEEGNFDKALEMLQRYQKDVKVLKTDKIAEQFITQASDCIIKRRKERYTPFYNPRKKYEPITLFDILDKYAMADEIWALDKTTFRSLFPYHVQEGYFEPITMPDNTVRLFPLGLALNVYYRGQSKYFPISKPSLYRDGMTEAKKFVERIKYEELKYLLEDYPLTHFFREDFYVNAPNGTALPLPLSIDALALAQHYGIKTELMDLTTDKFVAAFFATTDCKDNIPILTKRKEKGVFYRHVHIDMSLFGNKERLRAVGLQPLSRPGEQCGLVYAMGSDDDFNKIATIEEFEHDRDVSEFIFNYTNRSRKLFPYSPIQHRIDEICKSHIFSRRAYEQARKEFYSDVSEFDLKKYLEEEKIQISDETLFRFSEEEKSDAINRWNSGENKRIAKQILPRFVYNGPIAHADK